MIEKEVRALLPAWAACALAIVASRYATPALVYLGLPLFLIGTAGLGAWSVGHEYAHATLIPMLALPVPRWRWWTVKLAVLAPALVTLAGLAAALVVIDRGDRTFGAALFWLPALAALCIAPWLTMLARNPLAGAVFTLALVGASMVLGDWIGTYRYGYTREVDDFRRVFMWWMLGGLSVVGAAAGWLTFSRLQVANGGAHDLPLPAWVQTAPTAGSRRRPPLVALLVKELQLQQLTMVVAAGYAVVNLAILVLGHVSADVYLVFEVVVALYVTTMPALIGSLAGAEERHFGTHQSQLLMPMALWQQWFVKCAVAIALAVAVALLLPAALNMLLPLKAGRVGPAGMVSPQAMMLVLVCATVSLYVSTLARSGMTAVMYSVVAIPALAIFTSRVATWFGDRAFELVHQARAPHLHHTQILPGPYFSFRTVAVFVVAVCVLALPHYRYVDRRPRLVALQAALVATGITAYAVAFNVWMALRY